jgi:hypothetical protein
MVQLAYGLRCSNVVLRCHEAYWFPKDANMSNAPCAGGGLSSCAPESSTWQVFSLPQGREMRAQGSRVALNGANGHQPIY